MSTRKIASTAILAALATVFMYLEVPLPFMPPFLKFDFSEIPILIASFALGPWYGVIAEVLKNLIHFPFTQTAGIGELSNVIVGAVFVLIAGYVYKAKKTRKGAAVSMAVATLVLALFSAPFNYFITLPLYETVLHFDTASIIALCQTVNKHVTSKGQIILWCFVPFNLFKGIIVSLITFWVYKPISKLINRKY